jgi:hypothetical protein
MRRANKQHAKPSPLARLRDVWTDEDERGSAVVTVMRYRLSAATLPIQHVERYLPNSMSHTYARNIHGDVVTTSCRHAYRCHARCRSSIYVRRNVIIRTGRQTQHAMTATNSATSVQHYRYTYREFQIFCTWNYVFVEINFFREVGEEETNEPIDLDKHDQYYHHLFYGITKKQNCRCLPHGIGFWNIPEVRNKWFYLNDLFRFEPELYDMMHKSIGRAFIIKEYQQNQCHFLVVKGIMHTTLRYPEHKFLLGGVSISNQFSDFSKSLMIEFMKSNYYDPILYIHLQKKRTK